MVASDTILGIALGEPTPRDLCFSSAPRPSARGTVSVSATMC